MTESLAIVDVMRSVRLVNGRVSYVCHRQMEDVLHRFEGLGIAQSLLVTLERRDVVGVVFVLSLPGGHHKVFSASVAALLGSNKIHVFSEAGTWRFLSLAEMEVIEGEGAWIG